MAPQSAPPPRSRSSSGSGCLKGCLFALGLLLLPVVAVGLYGGWFLWQGYRHDPVLGAVSELVSRDGMAEAVLGQHIVITGVEGNAFSFVPGMGSRSDYVVTLRGSKASGRLAIEAGVQHGQVHIDAMILTGPAGDRYDLLHHVMTPTGRPTTSI